MKAIFSKYIDGPIMLIFPEVAMVAQCRNSRTISHSAIRVTLRKGLYLRGWIMLVLMFFCVCSMLAQQERQYSQFMYNKLAINPAFAGSLPSATFAALYRNQWMGFEGAPITQALSANLPFFNNRVGVGANLIRSTIGISEMWTLSGMYAYRIPLGNGFISGGMEGSLRYYGVNYNNPSLKADQNLASDNALIVENTQAIAPNVGLGLYYSDQQFYIGISVPRILKAKMDFKNDLLVSREVNHFYVMSGYSIEASEDFYVTPQVNLKFVRNSPISVDANIMLDFAKKFNAGVSYRSGGIHSALGESLDVLFGFKVVEPLFLGLAYDIQLGSLGKYSKGSVEAFMRYTLPTVDNVEVQNPRFF